MTDFIPTQQSLTARKAAITHEFDRLIKDLMARRVIRKSMVGEKFYVIYTEDGPKDIMLSRLAPCVAIYPGNCLCYDCTNEEHQEPPCCQSCSENNG
jgi:hypothetical protein